MGLKVYLQNIRGTKTKCLEIYNSILCNNYDIICLCETWLTEAILSSELFDERYRVIRRDRDANFFNLYNKNHGGGVLIALAKNLDFSFAPNE